MTAYKKRCLKHTLPPKSTPLEEATGGVISSLEEVANLNEELKYCLSTARETSKYHEI